MTRYCFYNVLCLECGKPVFSDIESNYTYCDECKGELMQDDLLERFESEE